jgi:hypothetical protein
MLTGGAARPDIECLGGSLPGPPQIAAMLALAAEAFEEAFGSFTALPAERGMRPIDLVQRSRIVLSVSSVFALGADAWRVPPAWFLSCAVSLSIRRAPFIA